MRAVRKSFRIAALATTAAVLVLTAGAPASAEDGDVEIVNTETVQVYMSPNGEIESQRVYEQLALTGSGDVEIYNPIETEGLRNLEGFDSIDVENGEQVVEATVDGEEKLRTVSDFDGELPLDISIEYKLDGEAVEPGDVVGEAGSLEVLFTVKNVTTQTQELTFDDGKGGTVTKSLDVPVPMVGSLTTVAPENFSNVASDQANMAGDGKGGTKLSFTMTLFPPIGSTTAEFGYTADIEDGVVPRVDVSALPVNPLESPSFASAASSYQGGADTGAELAAGATEIDSNLLRLRDGAAELLAGLIKLHGGADQLADGTVQLDEGAGELAEGTADLEDGAGQLADGADDASDGADQIADGTGRLEDGLDELGGGTGDLNGGVEQLVGGQKALARGLKKLYEGVESLPADVRRQLQSDPQYNALLGALQNMADGVGNRGDAPDAGTLLGGINAVQYGMRFPGPTTDCDVALTGGQPQRCGAMDGVEFIANQLASGATDLNQLKPVLGILNTGCPGAPGYPPPPTPPTNPCQAVATIYYALFGSSPAPPGAQAKVQLAANALTGIYQQVGQQLLADGAGLDQLRDGLSTGANPAVCATAPEGTCGIKEAALFLQQYGIPALVNGITTKISDTLLANIGRPTEGCDPEKTLRCAAAALAEGGTTLLDGVDQLVAGVTQLREGGTELADGAGDLSDGLVQLDDGADDLADGTVRLRDGADQLAEGTGDLRDGAELLADGTEEAAEGAPQLVDGSERLSEEGMQQLVEAGEQTAQSYGEMVAVLNAGAERAQTEKMAYGAPEESMGLTAYNYVIEGDDGEGGRNLTRGIAGLAILGAAAAVFALRRRLGLM